MAAFAVMLFHFAFRGSASGDMTLMSYPYVLPYATYGYLGVNLFFIISGFVILMSASGGSFRQFAISRMVRLYPAFWVCCSVTFAVIVIFGAPYHFATFKQYLYNMTMLSGFFYVPYIDGAYWSLVVEIQFYALVAVCLLLKQIGKAEEWLTCWLIISLALNIFPNDLLARIFILAYAPYFIAGGMFFFIWSRGVTSSRVIAVAVCWILAMYHAQQDIVDFQARYRTDLDLRIICGVITLFFGAFWLIARRSTGRIGSRSWIALGALTYPLYLVHEVIGYIIFNAAYPRFSQHLVFWGTVALMLLAAQAVHLFAERRYAPVMKKHLEMAWDAASLRIASLVSKRKILPESSRT